MKLIGLDLGTSSICGVLCDDGGKIIRSITRPNDAAPAEPSNLSEHVQDPHRIFAVTSEILDALYTESPRAAGIGLTGQMHGILYLDDEGRPLSPLFSWQDSRADQPFREGLSYAEYLSERTGRRTASGYGLATHFYNLRCHLVPRHAVSIGTIMDYTAMKLIGRTRPVIENSNAASLGLFDVRRGQFDEKALAAAEISTSILPQRVDFGPIGTWRGVPVWSAVGDNQSSFAGVVADRRHTVHVTVGTSAQTTRFSERFTETPNLETRPFPGGGFLLVGAALCGGSAWTVLKNFFEKTLEALGDKIPLEETLYAAMANWAAAAEHSDDFRPCVETTFAGTRTDPKKRGSIRNLTERNFTPQNLAAGFLHGVADELFRFFEQFPDRREVRTLCGSGNALRRIPSLRHAIEQKFHLPLELSECDVEAALGVCRFIESQIKIKQK